MRGGVFSALTGGDGRPSPRLKNKDVANPYIRPSLPCLGGKQATGLCP